jgi:hypothetical protein
MFRPVTSSVSALSGVVANGRRAMHHVSSSLSKIPYGGFSPVRLQIGLRPRPSPFAAYTRPIVRSSVGNDPFRGKHRSRGVRATSCRTVRSRGPWLAGGLCCPANSNATTASSEALGPSRRFMNYPAGLCPTHMERGPRDSPFYSACPSDRAVSRTPSDQAGLGCGFSRPCCLRHLRNGSASESPRTSILAWLRNEAAEFT